MCSQHDGPRTSQPAPSSDHDRQQCRPHTSQPAAYINHYRQQCPHNPTSAESRKIHASGILLPAHTNPAPRRQSRIPQQHPFSHIGSHPQTSHQFAGNSKRPPQIMAHGTLQHAKKHNSSPSTHQNYGHLLFCSPCRQTTRDLLYGLHGKPACESLGWLTTIFCCKRVRS